MIILNKQKVKRTLHPIAAIKPFGSKNEENGGKVFILVSKILINWEPVDLKNYLPASLSGIMVYCNPPFWLPSTNGPFEEGQSFENKTPFTPGWRSSDRNFSLIIHRQRLSGFSKCLDVLLFSPVPHEMARMYGHWNLKGYLMLKNCDCLSEIKDKIHLKCALFVCVC